MAEIVKAYLGQASAPKRGLEGAVEVPTQQGRASTGGEDEAVVLPEPGVEAERALRKAMGELDSSVTDQDEEEALRLAYPTIPERVCSETTHFDPHNPAPRPAPMDVHLDCRRVIHGLMRRAYLSGMDWLVEILEHEREHCSAQAAFAVEDYERKVGAPTT